jgi:hypothetical protein
MIDRSLQDSQSFSFLFEFVSPWWWNKAINFTTEVFKTTLKHLLSVCPSTLRADSFSSDLQDAG